MGAVAKGLIMLWGLMGKDATSMRPSQDHAAYTSVRRLDHNYTVRAAALSLFFSRLRLRLPQNTPTATTMVFYTQVVCILYLFIFTRSVTPPPPRAPPPSTGKSVGTPHLRSQAHQVAFVSSPASGRAARGDRAGVRRGAIEEGPGLVA